MSEAIVVDGCYGFSSRDPPEAIGPAITTILSEGNFRFSDYVSLLDFLLLLHPTEPFLERFTRHQGRLFSPCHSFFGNDNH